MSILQIFQEKNIDTLADKAGLFFKADHFILYVVAAIVIVYIVVKYVYKAKNNKLLENMTDDQIDHEFSSAPYFVIGNLKLNPDTFSQWSICKLQPQEDDTNLAKVIDVVHNDDGVIGTLPGGNDYLYDSLENGLEVMGVVELIKNPDNSIVARFHIDTTEFDDDDIKNFVGLNS